MRVLVLTKIFPNALEPLSSPFNRQQFAALGRLCETEVLATIPWFPGAGWLGSRWPASRLRNLPGKEIIDGLSVAHPRSYFVPKVGHSFSGVLYAGSLLPWLTERRGRFDVLLGSWAYPDGFATVALAKLFGVPSVVKLHGSDINVVAKMRGPELNLRWALPRASRVVAVSQKLGEQAVKLGAAPERVDVVRNGVDADLFYPRDRAQARRALGRAADEELIVYVGRLEAAKGVLDLLHAFGALQQRRPRAALVFVGNGAARGECLKLAEPLGSRVTFAGAQPLATIPEWMAAADIVTLPSWNEGTPNVILEAHACGRPVVATSVGGIPALLHADALGAMVPPRDPAALAGALERVLDGGKAGAHPAETIVSASGALSWADSAARLHAVLRRACEERRHNGSPR
jgi:glycosyltransferase involved in cell wall biosynthesis